MTRLLVLSLLFSLNVAAVAADTSAPQGANCALVAPPPEAGEETNHGVTLRIYPRIARIDAQYSGCQTLWAPAKNGWEIVSVTQITAGDPMRVWSPHASEDPERYACRYSEGKVVSGKAATCVAPESLLNHSVAPGCVAKMFKAFKAHQATNVRGCEYD